MATCTYGTCNNGHVVISLLTTVVAFVEQVLQCLQEISTLLPGIVALPLFHCLRSSSLVMMLVGFKLFDTCMFGKSTRREATCEEGYILYEGK